RGDRREEIAVDGAVHGVVVPPDHLDGVAAARGQGRDDEGQQAFHGASPASRVLRSARPASPARPVPSYQGSAFPQRWKRERLKGAARSVLGRVFWWEGRAGISPVHGAEALPRNIPLRSEFVIPPKLLVFGPLRGKQGRPDPFARCPMRRLPLVFVFFSLAVVPLRADDRADVQAALNREVIGPRQALVETQDYLDARIPRMPKVATAAEWEKVAAKLRADMLDKVVFRGEAAGWRDAKTKVEWQETIPGGEGYRIKKLRYEAVPGLWVPALLYEPEKLSGTVPVMLAVNGHDGNGKAANYKQIRCINLAKRGMLALNVEWLGMGQ